MIEQNEKAAEQEPTDNNEPKFLGYSEDGMAIYELSFGF